MGFLYLHLFMVYFLVARTAIEAQSTEPISVSINGSIPVKIVPNSPQAGYDLTQDTKNQQQNANKPIAVEINGVPSDIPELLKDFSNSDPQNGMKEPKTARTGSTSLRTPPPRSLSSAPATATRESKTLNNSVKQQQGLMPRDPQNEKQEQPETGMVSSANRLPASSSDAKVISQSVDSGSILRNEIKSQLSRNQLNTPQQPKSIGPISSGSNLASISLASTKPTRTGSNFGENGQVNQPKRLQTVENNVPPTFQTKLNTVPTKTGASSFEVGNKFSDSGFTQRQGPRSQTNAQQLPPAERSNTQPLGMSLPENNLSSNNQGIERQLNNKNNVIQDSVWSGPRVIKMNDPRPTQPSQGTGVLSTRRISVQNGVSSIVPVVTTTRNLRGNIIGQSQASLSQDVTRQKPPKSTTPMPRNRENNQGSSPNTGNVSQTPLLPNAFPSPGQQIGSRVNGESSVQPAQASLQRNKVNRREPPQNMGTIPQPGGLESVPNAMSLSNPDRVRNNVPVPLLRNETNNTQGSVQRAGAAPQVRKVQLDQNTMPSSKPEVGSRSSVGSNISKTQGPLPRNELDRQEPPQNMGVMPPVGGAALVPNTMPSRKPEGGVKNNVRSNIGPNVQVSLLRNETNTQRSGPKTVAATKAGKMQLDQNALSSKQPEVGLRSGNSTKLQMQGPLPANELNRQGPSQRTGAIPQARKTTPMPNTSGLSVPIESSRNMLNADTRVQEQGEERTHQTPSQRSGALSLPKEMPSLPKELTIDQPRNNVQSIVSDTRQPFFQEQLDELPSLPQTARGSAAEAPRTSFARTESSVRTARRLLPEDQMAAQTLPGLGKVPSVPNILSSDIPLFETRNRGKVEENPNRQSLPKSQANKPIPLQTKEGNTVVLQDNPTILDRGNRKPVSIVKEIDNKIFPEKTKAKQQVSPKMGSDADSKSFPKFRSDIPMRLLRRFKPDFAEIIPNLNDTGVRFFAMYPTRLYDQENYTACLHVMGSNVTTEFSVMLYHQSTYNEPIQSYSLEPEKEPEETFRILDSATKSFVPNGLPVCVTLNTSVENNLQLNVKLESRGAVRFLVTRHIYRSHSYGEKTMKIQTDKPAYKRGQLIRFRVFTLHYKNMSVADDTMTVFLRDGKNNKVAQWVCDKTSLGVCDGEYQLADHPVLGTWKLEASQCGEKQTGYFEVKEYVLSNYDIEVKMDEWSFGKSTVFGQNWSQPITGVIKAKYTFGDGVPGTADIVITPILRHLKPKESKSKAETTFKTSVDLEIDGETKFEIDQSVLQDLFGDEIYSYNMTYNIFDENQGETTSDSVSFRTSNRWPNIYVKDVPYKVEMNETSVTALVYVGYDEEYKLGYYDEKLMLEVRDDLSKALIYREYLTIGNDTRSINITIDLPLEIKEFHIWMKYKTLMDTRVIRRKTKTDEKHNLTEQPRNLTISVANEGLEVGDRVTFNISTKIPVNTIYYQIHARRELYEMGSLPMVSNETQLTIKLAWDLSPGCILLAYYFLPDGNVTMAAVKIDVDGIYLNNMNLTFNKPSVTPGEKVKVSIETAKPFSTVYLSAVDIATKNLGSGNKIEHDEIKRSFDSFFRIHYYGDPIGPADILRQINYEIFPRPKKEVVIYENRLFSKSARGSAEGMAYMAAADMPLDHSHKQSFTTNGKADVAEEDVRKDFSETWMWDIVMANKDGKAVLETKIPDSITTWTANAFAISPDLEYGMISKPVQLLSKKKFFIKLHLPFSVIRGESFAVKVSVFNYRDEDMNVQLILHNSSDFQNIFIPSPGERLLLSTPLTKPVFVKQGSANTTHFPIVAVKSGDINIQVTAFAFVVTDSVRRKLYVKNEGLPQRYSLPVIFTLNGEEDRHKLTISTPNNTVPDSVRVEIAAMGTPLESVAENIDGSLYMPYGCGEQNMYGFVQAFIVLNYLDSTGSVRPEIREKAVKYMNIGYSRQLRFQHEDGTFSSWGGDSGTGSIWLTAYVVKSFALAAKYIFISDEVLAKSISAILGDLEDGSIDTKDFTPNSYLTGGTTSSKAVLTAYTLIALLEASKQNMETYHAVKHVFPVVTAYLEESLRTVGENITDSNYTLAVTAYALLNVGSPESVRLLDILTDRADTSGGDMFWEDSSVPQHYYKWRPQRYASSLEVETAAYALLAYVQTNQQTKAGLVFHWLVKQQNAKGGFVSTQDTVMALQALAAFVERYMKSAKAPTNLSIKVASPDTEKRFWISEYNLDILQQKELNVLPKSLDVSAAGTGMAVFQANIFYNILQNTKDPQYNLTVKSKNRSPYGFTLDICFNQLSDKDIFMSLLEVSLPSGHTTSPDKLTYRSGLKHDNYEESDGKIILYYGKMERGNTTCLDIVLKEASLVGNAKPVPVQLYNYYEPSEVVTQFYNVPAYVETRGERGKLQEVLDLQK